MAPGGSDRQARAMRTIPLGGSGTDVSALCLGCMCFGTTVDERTSFALLDRYVDAGGRFLDTADNYAFWVDGAQGGESEALLGRWLRDRGARDDVFLATKVGANPTVPGRGTETAEGLSAAAIAKAVQGSLRRLGTDRIDLLYAHIDDRDTPLEETLGAFGGLVAAGTVGRVGVSNMRAWRVERARGTARWLGVAEPCCVQQRHSYLRPRPGSDFGVQVAVDDDLLHLCATEGVGLLAYSALLAGAYARADRPVPDAYAGADTDARLAALEAVAAEAGASPNQVVLAWMLAGNPPAIPLVAASTEPQLAENLAAVDLRLDAALLDRLDATGA
jgi:aryl-alcohol dehydrogenase-like predicted oxidoreductase